MNTSHTPTTDTLDFVCGMCANWYGGVCHHEQSLHFDTKRKGGAEACEFFAEEYHGTGWYIKDWIIHHKGAFAGAAAVFVLICVFLGVWFFTGDIWAAIIMFEILMEILGSFDF